MSSGGRNVNRGKRKIGKYERKRENEEISIEH
jgi:hypothetical protein